MKGKQGGLEVKQCLQTVKMRYETMRRLPLSHQSSWPASIRRLHIQSYPYGSKQECLANQT